MGGYSISEVVDRLGLIAIGWPPARTTVAETLLDRYVGRYTWWDGYRKRLATVTIARGPGGTLRLTSDRFVAQRERNALRRLTLAPMSDDVFFAIGAALWWGYTVRFELGDTPAADSLVYAYHSETTPPRYKRAA